jgi:hypothetical protein
MDIVESLRRYMSKLVLIINRGSHFEDQPWMEICYLIGKVDKDQFEDTLLQCWKCGDNMSDFHLGHYNLQNPSNYGGYMKAAYPETNLSARLQAFQQLLQDIDDHADVLGVRHHFTSCNFMFDMQSVLIKLGQYREADTLCSRF